MSVRSISALLLLCVSLLALPAGAPAQSVVAPQKAAPALAERLDRLATEFDRNRIDLHVPGAVLAIVRGKEMNFQVERVEVGVELALEPDTFTLGPFTTSSGSR